MIIKFFFFFLILIQGLVGSEESTKTKSPTISPVVQAVAISAAEKENSSDQSSRILSMVEANNMLEMLENPARREELVSGLKKTIRSDENDRVTLLSLKDLVFKAHTWINHENLKFLVLTCIRIFIILSIFALLRHLLNKTVNFYIKRISKEGLSKKQSSTFIKTIAPIIRSTLHWIFIGITILLILSEFNINIMPIIYSFSVITLAISLGSQTLVKDLINGAMTLFEGNMAVGDHVTIGHFSGTVESISLRCVHLRYGTGELQTIPFSEVNHVINSSRDYSVVDIGFVVSYEADQKDTDAALREAYDKIKKSPLFGAFVKGNLIIYGVSALNEWGFKVHAGVKTIPDPSKSFLNEFNRLLLIELQKRKVPLPRVTLLSSDTINPKPGGV